MKKKTRILRLIALSGLGGNLRGNIIKPTLMKRSFALLLALLISAIVFAQAPEKISYQAVIRDASEALELNKNIEITISILQGSPSGVQVYRETHTSQTNSNGLVSLEIGSGVVDYGLLSAINWGKNEPYFIKTETIIGGYSIINTAELRSVPYALFAKNAATVNGFRVDTAIPSDAVFTDNQKATEISLTTTMDIDSDGTHETTVETAIIKLQEELIELQNTCRKLNEFSDDFESILNEQNVSEVTSEIFIPDVYPDVSNYEEGSVWGEGHLKEGDPNGHGTLTFDDGSYYEGEMKFRLPNGYGKLTLSDGTYYEGAFIYGYANGQGKYYHENGDLIYEGAFIDGSANGQGKQIYPDGSYYDGAVENGKLNGQGKYTYSDGTYYEGGWEYGLPNGNGKRTYADGYYYEGTWKDGKKHGHGKYTYSDGTYYEGGWEDGEKHGSGSFYLTNGMHYEEKWKHGIRVKIDL